jgi:hypothetical protein
MGRHFSPILILLGVQIDPISRFSEDAIEVIKEMFDRTA